MNFIREPALPFLFSAHMGTIKQHPPVKAFAGITFQTEKQLVSVLDKLSETFGTIDIKSGIFSFDRFTDYYQAEMGSGLQKILVSFETCIPVSYLPKMKIKTNHMEEGFMVDGKRSVNIDPGYLTLAKVVLATTKDYIHRLYLSDGIFGDLHLTFKNGTYRAQPWTYPDYSQELVETFFLKMRSLYHQKTVENL